MLHSAAGNVTIFLIDIIRYSLFNQGDRLGSDSFGGDAHTRQNTLTGPLVRTQVKQSEADNNQSVQSRSEWLHRLQLLPNRLAVKEELAGAESEHRLQRLRHVKNELISSSLFHCNLVRCGGNRQRPQPILIHHH